MLCVCACMCMCVRVCMCTCVHACVCTCARAHVCYSLCAHLPHGNIVCVPFHSLLFSSRLSSTLTPGLMCSVLLNACFPCRLFSLLHSLFSKLRSLSSYSPWAACSVWEGVCVLYTSAQGTGYIRCLPVCSVCCGLCW